MIDNEQTEIKTFKLSELDELKQAELDSEDLLLVSDSITSTNKKYISKKLAIGTLADAIDLHAIKPIRELLAKDEANIKKLSSDEELSCVKYADVNGGKEAITESNKIATLKDILHSGGGTQISVDGEEVDHFAACHISYDDYAKKMLSSELDEDTLYVVGNDSIICYDKRLTDVGNPASDKDAVTKKYVDDFVDEAQTRMSDMEYYLASLIDNRVSEALQYTDLLRYDMTNLMSDCSYNFSEDSEVKRCIRDLATRLGAKIDDMMMKASSAPAQKQQFNSRKAEFKPKKAEKPMSREDKIQKGLVEMMKKRMSK